MWTTWSDFDRHFNAINAFRSQLERAFGHDAQPEKGFASWPEARMVDEGKAYSVSVDVPGLTEEDVNIDLEDRTLTVEAKRELEVPDGQTLVRSERRPYEWRRSLTLPGSVDPEQTHASLDNGVLTVRLEKVPERQPRRITVQ